MSRFEEIVGHENAVAGLEGMLDRARVPHALLFHGPSEVGKATVARLLARALLCRENGCGQCDDCRLFDRGSHPDFVLVERQLRKDSKTELRQQIVVDQVRELSSVIALAPRHGARRVFLIDPADRMNSEAQNALLKTLEEPPPHAVLILVAARPQVLTSTVRSRCFALGFAPLRAETLSRALEARGFEHREALARSALAEGRVGRALELDLEGLRERRETVLQGLESLVLRRNVRVLEKLGAALAGKDETAMQSNLELLMGLLRDAARAAHGGDVTELVHADLADRLAELGRGLGPRRAADLVAATDRLRHELRFNLNRTLVAESVLAAVAGGPLPV